MGLKGRVGENETMIKKTLQAGWLLLVATLLPLGGCQKPSAADPDDAGTDAVAAVATQDSDVVAVDVRENYVDSFDLPGASVHGFEVTQLVAKQAGYVKSLGRVPQTGKETALTVDIGVSITRGTVLAELEIPELEEDVRGTQAAHRKAQAEVVQAQAAIKIAVAMVTQTEQTLVEKEARRELRKVELQRITRLVKMGALDLDKQDEGRFHLKAAVALVASTRAEILTVQANLEKSRADLQQSEAAAEGAATLVKRAEVLADYRFVRAPFDGVIVARHVDRGAFVRPAGGNGQGSVLFELARTDKLRVVAFVPPGQIAGVRTAIPARLHSIGGLPGTTVSGTLDRTALALDQGSRKMRVEMHVENTGQGQATPLTLGLFGTLTIQRKQYPRLAVVPTTAIGIDSQNGHRFVVVVKNGQNKRVEVQVVFDDAKQVGIVGDVHSGDLVRSGGLDKYSSSKSP